MGGDRGEVVGHMKFSNANVLHGAMVSELSTRLHVRGAFGARAGGASAGPARDPAGGARRAPWPGCPREGGVLA